MKKFVFAIVLIFCVTSCGVRSIPEAKNNVDAAFAEISNQYKRRSDLIPNLVSTVKGYAAHEKETLTEVTEARSKVSQTVIDPSKATPKQLLDFQQAQSALTQALGKLMMISERYPELKADKSFQDLQAQLEGTENRIAVARRRYIDSIQNFNNQITVPPESFVNSLFYHYDKMPQWDLSPEEKTKSEQPPNVKF